MNEDQFNGINRRHFLSALTAVGIGGYITQSASKDSVLASGAEPESSNFPFGAESEGFDLLDSFPILQNPTTDSVNVVWAIKKAATGWVEWGTTKELGNIAQNSQFGLKPYADRFLSNRIAGLKPNSTYYYRTVTVPIDFKHAYLILPGTPVFSHIYSFTTPGENTDSASFAVMNDTHQNLKTLAALTKRFSELNPDYILWNGDLRDDYPSANAVVESILRPNNVPFAVEKPLLFVPGNHDSRGIWARNLPLALTPWIQNDARYYALGRNFAVRQGPVAFIGLDTGEDKPDANPVWGGLALFEPYRELQAAWLADILETPEIKKAPFVIAFCHIPLFDPDPNANPGDLLTHYAAYQRPCQKLWSPLFNKHKVQLLITAHQHRFRYDSPDENRSWSQIVGGGPDLKKNATLIYGKVEAQKLIVSVEKVADQSNLGTYEFEPRFS
ncbi:MAG: FN3 domain-containing metallophosphoesterase family protein [Planctomycetia bacterium]|nr:FN3 domain-containing metallophosphoesterase family protein [Planctomycetia bacterium]